jgi:hypothetical protein
LLIFFIDAVF